MYLCLSAVNILFEMEVKVKETSPCERMLEISLPPDQVKEKIKELYTRYQRTADIKGFRKGKIPMDIIKSRFGETIRKEAINDIIGKTYRDVIQEKGFSPISQGIIQETKFKEEEGLSFKAIFEILPDIKLENYKGIEVKIPSTEPSKEEIQNALSVLQNSKAIYTPVSSRGARDDDMILADYEILKEEKGVLRKNKVSNYTILLDNPELPKEIRDKLAGAMPGDRRKASLRYPTDFKDESLRGQLIEYEFLVREVKEKKLPEIDDEFAKDFGLKSLSELREQTKEMLKKEKGKDSKAKVETQIINSLIQDNPLEVPRVVVSAYLEPLLKRVGKDADDKVKKSIEEIAVWRAKREILLNKIGELEGIELKDEETKSRLMENEEWKRMGYDHTVKELKKEGFYDLLVEEFRREKVLDFLRNQAEIKKK